MKPAPMFAVTAAVTVVLALSSSASGRPHGDPEDPAAPTFALGAAFTFQGQLKKNGAPVTAACAGVFRLFDDASAGTQLGVFTTTLNSNAGLFTAPLDFGADVFRGEARWLQVSVKCPGDGAFVSLLPRTILNPAPYALYAASTGPHTHFGQVWSGAAAGESGLRVENSAGNGLYGAGTLNGVSGIGTGGNGVAGVSDVQTGVRGMSDTGNGVWGTSNTATGVIGQGATGVSGTGEQYGVLGLGPQAVRGVSSPAAGIGVVGYASSTDDNPLTRGVYGQSDAPNGRGVHGYAPAANGIGVYGNASIGVSGDGAQYGVLGTGPDGVRGLSVIDGGIGVVGYASYTASNSLTRGGYGQSDGVGGRGVHGYASKAFGVGVYGNSSSAGKGTGVYGSGGGVDAYGVYGIAADPGGTGVVGNGDVVGVQGGSESGWGILGVTTSGLAGKFFGDVDVTGLCCLAAVSATRIDHPLDPANKYLQLAAVESPDMITVYNGTVTTDLRGDAVVKLPAYAEALDRDFRYQLTVIGQFARAIIASEVNANRFSVKTDKPNVKVSWQVTGVRHDAYAVSHGLNAEVPKTDAERGRYRYPAEAGQPQSAGIGGVRR